MEDRTLPDEAECPFGKEDCDGCGGCDLIKYYEDRLDEDKNES